MFFSVSDSDNLEIHRLLNRTQLELVQTIPDPYASRVFLSHDLQFLGLISYQKIMLFKKGKDEFEKCLDTDLDYGVYSVTISYDHKYLLTSDLSDTVRVYLIDFSNPSILVETNLLKTEFTFGIVISPNHQGLFMSTKTSGNWIV